MMHQSAMNVNAAEKECLSRVGTTECGCTNTYHNAIIYTGCSFNCFQKGALSIPQASGISLKPIMLSKTSLNCVKKTLNWHSIGEDHCQVLIKSITMSFLIVGHTKFAPDWVFRLLKQRFRKTRVDCLDDLVRVVEGSAESTMRNW